MKSEECGTPEIPEAMEEWALSCRYDRPTLYTYARVYSPPLRYLALKVRYSFMTLIRLRHL